MPTDLRFPFAFEERGDVAAATGAEFYKRHLFQLTLIAAEQKKGDAITNKTVIEIQSTVEQIIRNSPYFDPPVETQVTDVTDDTITLAVGAQNTATHEIDV